MRQALRPELSEQPLRPLVPDELRHVAAGAGGVVLVKVLHGEGEVGVVDVFDRHNVDHDAHLTRPVAGSLVKFGGFGIRLKTHIDKFVHDSASNLDNFDETRFKSDFK